MEKRLAKCIEEDTSGNITVNNWYNIEVDTESSFLKVIEDDGNVYDWGISAFGKNFDKWFPKSEETILAKKYGEDWRKATFACMFMGGFLCLTNDGFNIFDDIKKVDLIEVGDWVHVIGDNTFVKVVEGLMLDEVNYDESYRKITDKEFIKQLDKYNG